MSKVKTKTVFEKPDGTELPVFKTVNGVEMIASKTKVFIVWRVDDDEKPFLVLDVRYLGRTPKDIDPREDLAFNAGDLELGIPRIYYFAADADLIFTSREEAEAKCAELLGEVLPGLSRQRVAHAQAMLKALDGDDLEKYGPRLLTDVIRFVKNDPKASLVGGTGAKRRTVRETLEKLTDKEKKEARASAEATIAKYAKLLGPAPTPEPKAPKAKKEGKAKKG